MTSLQNIDGRRANDAACYTFFGAFGWYSRMIFIYIVAVSLSLFLSILRKVYILTQPWQFRSFCFGKKVSTQNSFSCIYVGKMLIYVGNFFCLPQIKFAVKYIILRFIVSCTHVSVWTYKAPVSNVEIEPYLSTIFCYGS